MYYNFFHEVKGRGMSMIFVDNRQNTIEVTGEVVERIENTVMFTLEEEKVNIPWQISVLLVDNKSIKELNKEYRNIDKATDVLSFPMLDFENGKVYSEVFDGTKPSAEYFDGEELVLGDMVISLEKALEQSEEYGHSFTREICYLTVHSVLHLLGYDHMEEDDKKIMRKREDHILEMLRIHRS
jgi:probable rRNA maturation factor